MILLHFFTTCVLGLDFRLPFSRFLRTFFLSFSLYVWGDVCGGFYNQQERSGSCYITQCPLLFPSLARRKPNWVLFWTQIKTNRPAPNARRTKSDFICTFLHYPRTVKHCMFNLYKPCTHRQRENCAVHTYYSNETILFFLPSVFLSAAV